jgi:hypothetical protein
MRHAQALLASNKHGATACIEADLRDTPKILDEAARVLDFGQPVAVMLLGVLHCIPDEDDPAAIVAGLMAAVPPGSYLTVAHPASDVTEQLSRSMNDYNEQGAAPLTARSHTEVSRFLRRPRSGGARRGAATPVAGRKCGGGPRPRTARLRRSRTEAVGAALPRRIHHHRPGGASPLLRAG